MKAKAKQERQEFMRILARATESELDALIAATGSAVAYDFIRPPEIGLTMVRARAGGTGQKFNLGEVTTTRCSIRLTDGREGHAYILGRHKKRAELAARVDALLQEQTGVHTVDRKTFATISGPIEARIQAEKAIVETKAAATKVDFFTLVRGA